MHPAVRGTGEPGAKSGHDVGSVRKTKPSSTHLTPLTWCVLQSAYLALAELPIPSMPEEPRFTLMLRHPMLPHRPLYQLDRVPFDGIMAYRSNHSTSPTWHQLFCMLFRPNIPCVLVPETADCSISRFSQRQGALLKLSLGSCNEGYWRFYRAGWRSKAMVISDTGSIPGYSEPRTQDGKRCFFFSIVS